MRCIIGSIACSVVIGSLAVAEAPPGPKTVYWEPAQLIATKQRLPNPDQELRKTLSKLRSNADQALQEGPYAVTQKKELPPSGDKHDYLSYSRYWWPNPETDDGLPYIRRDGETNVAMRSKGDRDQIGQLFYDVESLALAYYFFNEDKYAAHASLLIQTWFLNPETKMNPHLKYGQAVLGRSEGRGVGIIDTRGFIVLLDCVALLSESPSFSSADQLGLQQWFSEFLDWLRSSKLGKEESEAENNHGSWYAAQVARIAIHIGADDIARKVVETVRTIRIPDQFQADGSQPYENERTKSLHYSFFNLSALSVVARVGEQLGIDLWQSPAGGSGNLRSGLYYLRPYLAAQKNWPHQQLEEFELAPRIIQLLRMASVRFDDPEFAKAIGQIGHRHADRNYSPLVCAALHRNVEKSSSPIITISAGDKATLKTYELPDISRYTLENIRKLLPSTRAGLASNGLTAGETLLNEAFRKERGVDLQSRQGTTDTRTIKITRGAVTLQQLVQQLDDESIASEHDSVVTIRLPILIQPGGTLIVDGTETPELRLSTDRGAFVANAGTLFILDAIVTSWDEQEKQPTPFVKEADFRPFISSYIRSKTYLAGSTFQNLGFHAPTAYGLSLSSHPERNRGEVIDDWPTGQIVGNVFRGMFYGFYSYEARDVAIVGNTYDDSIRYGIDPHDRSTRLIIAKNTAKNTRERHGIIGSRGIADSFVFNNRSFDNNGSGIMLDRQCTGNVIANNQVFNNGQGIAVYESSNNLVANNTIIANEKSGVRIRNSIEISVQENTVVGNGDYGFEVYSKRLEDHDKRVARGDDYVVRVEARIHGNVVTGNQRGCIKGSNVHLLRLSNFHFRPNAAEIEHLSPKTKGRLDVSDDQNFGSELKPFSAKLRRVFDDSKPVVEFKRG